MSDRVALLNMDCMEYMATLGDKEFDLAIVDPPYGITSRSHRKNNRSKLAKSKVYHTALWDQPTPGPAYFRELERVSRNQIVWGGNHLAAEIGKNSPCWIVWDKHGTGNFADCELAYTSFKSAVRKISYPWNGMIQGFNGTKSKEVRIHPTQKPVALYTWILEKYGGGGPILDTHLGSASSAIAASRLGYTFVGTEIDPIYYQQGKARFEEETRKHG